MKARKPIICILPDEAAGIKDGDSGAALIEFNRSVWGRLVLLSASAAAGSLAVELAAPLFARLRDAKKSGNDIEKVLQEVQKEIGSLSFFDPSSVIEPISYQDAIDNLRFPPGHPMYGRPYRVHPLKSKKEFYIPFESFNSLLYEE